MQRSAKPGFGVDRRRAQCLCAVAILLLPLLFVGCSLQLEQVARVSPEQELFQLGIDALATNDSPEEFARLTAEFPYSPWAARAKTIIRIQSELNASREELARLRKGLDDCRKSLEGGRNERDKLAADVRSRDELQKNIDACNVEKARLGSDVRSLEKYISKLKSLLIESGIAEPSLPVR